MESPRTDAEGDRFFDGVVGLSALGVAYLAVGVGLFYSLTVDSMALFSAVLAATLVLVLVSLYVVYRREGLVTAENRVVGGFVLAAMALCFGLYALTDLSSDVLFVVLIVVGVIAPELLLEYTDYGRSE